MIALARPSRLAVAAVLLAAVGAAVGSCRSIRSGSERAAERGPPAAASGLSPEPGPGSAPSDASAEGGADGEATGDASRPALTPIVSTRPIVELKVDGFRDAVVSLPLGATTPRPVIVALHGNYDRPEWQCEVWRDLVRSGCFVLCPRGIPRADAPKSEDRWTYGALTQTERELAAAIEALKQRYPEHVDAEHALFAGFSLGAILGRSIVKREGAKFSRVVLTEGAQSGWSAGAVKALKAAGVERVLFACGQSACAGAARASVRIFERGGLEARVADGGNVGHTYDGAVAAAISREWAWLVAQDPVWESVLE